MKKIVKGVNDTEEEGYDREEDGEGGGGGTSLVEGGGEQI